MGRELDPAAPLDLKIARKLGDQRLLGIRTFDIDQLAFAEALDKRHRTIEDKL